MSNLALWFNSFLLFQQGKGIIEHHFNAFIIRMSCIISTISASIRNMADATFDAIFNLLPVHHSHFTVLYLCIFQTVHRKHIRI